MKCVDMYACPVPFYLEREREGGEERRQQVRDVEMHPMAVEQ